MNYKELYEEMREMYNRLPKSFDVIPMGEILEVLELYKTLEKEPNGLTLEEINKKNDSTYFLKEEMDYYEEIGLIEKGVIVTGSIHFKDRVEDFEEKEIRYFPTEKKVRDNKKEVMMKTILKL